MSPMQLQLRLPKLHIPYLCRGSMVLRVLVLSQAVSVVLAFSPGVSGDIWSRLGFISVFVHWISMLTMLCLCMARNAINSLPQLGLIAAVLLTILLSTLCISAIAFFNFNTFFSSIGQEISGFILRNLLIAGIAGIVAIQFFILHAEKSEQLNAQTHAELNALQARIQPHFLFNTLNTVAELTHVDAAAAEKSLLSLAALFRAALNAGQLVPLATELELAHSYLKLEQWRLGERMNIKWQIPPQLPEVMIPALTIQPLLENAIRYGVECSAQHSTITADCVETRTAISIVITNPFYADIKVAQGNGIALNNIRQRLSLHYGDSARLIVGLVDNTYRVKLVIPK